MNFAAATALDAAANASFFGRTEANEQLYMWLPSTRPATDALWASATYDTAIACAASEIASKAADEFVLVNRAQDTTAFHFQLSLLPFALQKEDLLIYGTTAEDGTKFRITSFSSQGGKGTIEAEAVR